MLQNIKKNTQKNQIKAGFTLAEVLITLGIIGVVATMTIPSLIQNTNSSKFASQFKKTLSQINQAALMATAQWDADYGTIDGKDAGGTDKSPCAESDSLAGDDGTICGLFNSTLSGATFLSNDNLKKITANGKAYSSVKTAVANTTYVTLTDMIGYQLADGSLLVIPQGMKECTIKGALDDCHLAGNCTGDKASENLSGCIGFIDVNGAGLPNKEVSCEKSSDTALNSSSICTVPKTPSHSTDIYPIVFHDQTVEPATNAARAVLTSTTANK